MNKTCLIDGPWAGRIVEDDGRIEYRFPLPSQVALADSIKREGQGRLKVEIYECRYIRMQPVDGLYFYVWEYADYRGNVWALLHRQIKIHAEEFEKQQAYFFHLFSASLKRRLLTDEQIDRAIYEQTGFDGDGCQAMTIEEIRRIVRASIETKWGA